MTKRRRLDIPQIEFAQDALVFLGRQTVVGDGAINQRLKLARHDIALDGRSLAELGVVVFFVGHSSQGLRWQTAMQKILPVVDWVEDGREVGDVWCSNVLYHEYLLNILGVSVVVACRASPYQASTPDSPQRGSMGVKRFQKRLAV